MFIYIISLKWYSDLIVSNFTGKKWLVWLLKRDNISSLEYSNRNLVDQILSVKKIVFSRFLPEHWRDSRLSKGYSVLLTTSFTYSSPLWFISWLAAAGRLNLHDEGLELGTTAWVIDFELASHITWNGFPFVNRLTSGVHYKVIRTKRF